MSYHLITCIVERGQADKTVNAAISAGAQAATLFYARGRGLREKLGLMGRFILPEKEVILIVTREKETQAVFDAITVSAQLKVPGKGFAYIQPVEQVEGFFDRFQETK